MYQTRMKFFILILAAIDASGQSQKSCDLVPLSSDPGSCMHLTSESYITADYSEFGKAIEGASTNPRGEMFAVNYGDGSPKFTIGQFYPSQRLFYKDLNTSSHLNGIRFLDENTAFVADVENKRVLKLTVKVNNIGENIVTGNQIYCESQSFLQPNDLALSKTGTVFTSGMSWAGNIGDIWSCTPNGRITRLELMGRTNGIDLSPDEKTLYVSESLNQGDDPHLQKIWKYSVDVFKGSIAGKSLFVDFAKLDGTGHIDIDGMRTDVEGNLFVTRNGGREIVIFNPVGEVIGKIRTSFQNPKNLEFGGDDGTTLFIVGKCNDGDGVDKGCVDTIEVKNPGRAWSNLQKSK